MVDENTENLCNGRITIGDDTEQEGLQNRRSEPGDLDRVFRELMSRRLYSAIRCPRGSNRTENCPVVSASRWSSAV